MPSNAGPVLDPEVPDSGGDDAKNPNPWEQAWKTLSDEDKKEHGLPSSSMLDVLKSVSKAYGASATNETHVRLADLSFVDKVQEVTETKQKACVEKGWTVYRNKNGEKVKLRLVLEKTSVWVKELLKIVDVGVSADQSGHAALPWAIVKLITEVGVIILQILTFTEMKSVDRILRYRGF